MVSRAEKLEYEKRDAHSVLRLLRLYACADVFTYHATIRILGVTLRSIQDEHRLSQESSHHRSEEIRIQLTTMAISGKVLWH